MGTISTDDLVWELELFEQRLKDAELLGDDERIIKESTALYVLLKQVSAQTT